MTRSLLGGSLSLPGLALERKKSFNRIGKGPNSEMKNAVFIFMVDKILESLPVNIATMMSNADAFLFEYCIGVWQCLESGSSFVPMTNIF